MEQENQEINSSFTMIDQNGVEKEYDVLFTFEDSFKERLFSMMK